MAPSVAVAEPLFAGSVYLADLRFLSPGASASVAPADLQVVQEYLGRIAAPIQAYASQYGPTRLHVGAPLPPLRVSLPGTHYSDAQLQGWVDQLVGAQGLPPNAAVLVLNPPGVVNTDAQESGGVGVLGYHGLARVPYCFVNLPGSGLSVADGGDLFAEAVSHEVAEMTVDPRADDRNPEVCDGCGTNCQATAAYRAYFDASGAYLGTDTQFPPPFSYAFFLSAIAKPPAAADCPAPASACSYPPPVSAA